MEENKLPIIGEKFPNIESSTTHGKISIPGDYRGKWFVFFSHPGDFTPVCTTEFYAFQKRHEYFKEIDCELIGLSIDQIFSHIKWVEWIGQNLGQEIEFPIIADEQGKIAEKLNMIHPQKGTNTVRAVFIVDNLGIIRTILYYPQELGRNIDEILRIVKSLQIADQKNLAIPANWPNNEIIGSKGIIHPPRDEKTAKERLESSKKGEIECKDWWFCYKKVFEESDYEIETKKSAVKPSVYYLEETEKPEKSDEKDNISKKDEKSREIDLKDSYKENLTNQEQHETQKEKPDEKEDFKEKSGNVKEDLGKGFETKYKEESLTEKIERDFFGDLDKENYRNQENDEKNYQKETNPMFSQKPETEKNYEKADFLKQSEFSEPEKEDRKNFMSFDIEPDKKTNEPERDSLDRKTSENLLDEDYGEDLDVYPEDEETDEEDYYELYENDEEEEDERDREFYNYKYGLYEDEEPGEETYYG